MEVNLKNLCANFCAIRDKVKGAEPFAVIKADAYGHGVVKVFESLIGVGCRRVAVAIPEEALELRSCGVEGADKVGILILGGPAYSAADELVSNDIAAACTDVKFAEAMSAAAVKQGKKAKIHFKIDTGMGRIGFLPSEFAEAAQKILALPALEAEGIFTHFAVADEASPDWTNHQFGEYKKALAVLESKGVKVKYRHVCNSAGILVHPDKYLDAVRPGVILYGMYPSGDVEKTIDLKPTFEIKTGIAVMREHDASVGISYGLRYITRAHQRIAVLPIGYADGWSRALSMKTDVLIHGKRCPQVGSICMDQMMVDVSGIENPAVGDEVVLLGRQGGEYISPEEIGACRGTINYEVPCAIQKRVPRVYL